MERKVLIAFLHIQKTISYELIFIFISFFNPTQIGINTRYSSTYFTLILILNHLTLMQHLTLMNQLTLRHIEYIDPFIISDPNLTTIINDLVDVWPILLINHSHPFHQIDQPFTIEPIFFYFPNILFYQMLIDLEIIEIINLGYLFHS